MENCRVHIRIDLSSKNGIALERLPKFFINLMWVKT